jgi:hypothetical protein
MAGKRRAWFLIAWLCALLLALWLPAQDRAGKPAETAAVSSVKQAMGGARWDEIRTLHARGRAEIGELQGEYETWLDLPRQWSYTDMRFSHPAVGDVRSTTGWNGSVSWSADQTGDVCVEESLEARRGAAIDAYLESFAYLLKSTPPESVKLKSGRQRFHILLITPPEASPFELWMDRTTGRIARLVRLTGVDRDVTTYADFRDSGGLLLPFHIEERDARSGRLSSARTVNSIEIDREPPEHVFDPPPATLTGLVFPAGRDSVSVPFRWDDGHLYLPVSINGRRLENFVFDTGQDNTIDAGRAGSLGLKAVRAGAAYGGGTEAVESGIARVERLEVGALRMENQVIDVTPLPQVGAPLDGALGYELAKRAVVTLDYALHRITFTRPESFRPPEGATRLRMRFASTSEIVLDGSVDGIAGEFQLDTGQESSLVLNRPFAERNGLLRKYRSGRKSWGVGVGGAARTVLFRPSRFSLGSLDPSISQAEIALSKTGGAAEEYIAGTIGNDILRQYKVTLDYARGLAHLEKEASYKDAKDLTYKILRPNPRKHAHPGDLGLIRLGRTPAGALEILEMTADGVAARNGIERGDWILAINGSPVGGLNLEETFAPITAAPGASVKLTIRHGDQVREVTLTTE